MSSPQSNEAATSGDKESSNEANHREEKTTSQSLIDSDSEKLASPSKSSTSTRQDVNNNNLHTRSSDSLARDEQSKRDELLANTNSQRAEGLFDDHRTRLLAGDESNSVYNECTVPLSSHRDSKKRLAASLFTRGQKSRNFSESDSSTNPRDDLGNAATSCGFMMVNLNNVDSQDHASENGNEDDNEDEDDDDLAQVHVTRHQNSNKASLSSDTIQKSINNIRLNVNNHIIGGSKNVMGRMRKLSMNELNRHRNSANKGKYKVAFYVTLVSLSFLFLYLIYQNLFNDR